MSEWLSNIGNIIGLPGIIAGIFASLYVLFDNKQKRIAKRMSLILIILMGLFSFLWYFGDTILVHCGLGAPNWSDELYSESVLNKIPEQQKVIRFGIYDLMWLLTFKIFPIGLFLLGIVLTFLSIINKAENKIVYWSILGLFMLFTLAILTISEQFTWMMGQL
jgi:hypothetical protein